jgi:hypothetical protein
MQAANPAQSQPLGNPPSAPIRALLAEAIRFWEPRRLLYNLVLATVVGIWLTTTWPHFRPMMKFNSLLLLAILALLANICYCAAYLVDIPLQGSSPSALRRGRWALWVLGTLFAILLANYWIVDEIYPFV